MTVTSTALTQLLMDEYGNMSFPMEIITTKPD